MSLLKNFFLQGKTDDIILFYELETTLQLYIAESSANLRKLYNVSYSLPNLSENIYHIIKIRKIYIETMSDLETKHFYKRDCICWSYEKLYASAM